MKKSILIVCALMCVHIGFSQSTQKLAKQGDAKAQYQIGRSHDHFLSRKIALRWYLKSAQNGYAEAQHKIAEVHSVSYYSKKYHTDLNYELAEEYYRKAAEQNYCYSFYPLACIYESHTKEYNKAVEWYIKNNDWYKAGLLYEKGGYGLPQDYEKAYDYYKKTTKNWQYSDAQSAIKRIQPKIDSINYVRKAVRDKQILDSVAVVLANTKSPQKLYELGLWLDEHNYDNQAFSSFLKAAQMNHINAEMVVAKMYMYGKGTEKSLATSFSWYKKAATAGNVDAMIIVADGYYTGDLTKQDYKNAVIWYQKAANKKNWWAYYRLGQCYENGQGVVRNNTTALQWYNKAAAAGYSTASTASSSLKNRMNNDKANPYVAAGLRAYNARQYNKAIESFKTAVNLVNDPYSLYYIGLSYKALDNTDQARMYFQQAVNGGYDIAEGELAEIEYNIGKQHYQRGEYQEALVALKKADQYGSAEAANYLGLMYDNGYGVVRNDNTALDYFRTAKNRGCSLAVDNYNTVKQRIDKRNADEQRAIENERIAQENERRARENEQRALELQRQANLQQQQALIQQQQLINEQQATRQMLQQQQQQQGQQYNTSGGGNSSSGSYSKSGSSSSSHRVECVNCHGNGKCQSCAGRGEKSYNGEKKDCMTCKGSGNCYYCHGRGYKYAH